MTGDQFLTSLKAKIAPATIKAQRGLTDGISFTLSTGKAITAKRASIKACANQAALNAYVTQVTA